MQLDKDPSYDRLLDLARTPVESSNVAALAFDATMQAIVVEFHYKSEVYAYFPCTREEYEKLETAESVGIHFNQHIKKSKDKDWVKLT